MEQILTEIQKLKKELSEIRSQLEEYENSRLFDNWIPRKKLMEYFDYGDTQIVALFKKGNLVVSEIGNRKFIKKESVIKYLEQNANMRK